MATAIVDRNRRIVIPWAKPGDEYEIRTERDGRILLRRLQDTSKAARRMTRDDCLRAMVADPLKPELSWPELKNLTRDFAGDQ